MLLTFSVTAFADMAFEDVCKDTVDAVFETENEIVKFDNDFLNAAGSTAGDWFVIALKALGVEADYQSYLNALESYVVDKYKTYDRLHSVKATEWHRISLAVLSCGGDPESFGGVNLIADGIFDFDLDKQGLNAYNWALICLSSGNFTPSANSLNTKENIIDRILDKQLPDGGFALSANTGDPDITAITLTALSPFVSDERVRASVDKALTFLSEAQLDNGGFESYGVENCESSCQVAIALCSLGIDLNADERFIKNKKTVLDAINGFYIENNGFSHIKNGDENSFSTVQALLAFGAVKKQTEENKCVFDFNADTENENTAKAFSDADRRMIEKLSESVCASDIPTIKRLLQGLESIKESDDYFVLNTSLGMSLMKAEEIQKKIDEINKKVNGMSDRKLKLSDKKELEDMIESYEKLSENDKKLVTYAEELFTLKAQLDTKLRQTIITAVIIAVILTGVVYLCLRNKKRKKDD